MSDPLASPAQLADRPLFEPIAAWLRRCEDLPDVRRLDGWLDGRCVSGGGRPIRFVAEEAGPGYEERIFLTGEVPTRPAHWHDFFNALVWLAFPLAKAALNGRHHRASQARRLAGLAGRGPLRDAATQFDECGVVVASADPEVPDLVRAHRWKELFWTRREAIWRRTRVIVFGHATYDQLRAPFVGLCGKAVFMAMGDDFLAGSAAHLAAAVDARLAAAFADDGKYAAPRDFSPLPLLGVPGVVAGNACADYYDDTRQFRALRQTSF